MVSRNMQEPSRFPTPNTQDAQNDKGAGEATGLSLTSQSGAVPVAKEGTSDAIILDPERLPTWQRPFVLAPNVRFTRTPGKATSPKTNMASAALASHRLEVQPTTGRVDGEPQATLAGSPARVLQQRLEKSIEHQPAFKAHLHQGVVVNEAGPLPLVQPKAGGAQTLPGIIQETGISPATNAPSLATVQNSNKTLGAETSSTGRRPLYLPDHLLWEMLSLGVSDLPVRASRDVHSAQRSTHPRATAQHGDVTSAPVPVAAEERQSVTLQASQAASAVHLYRQVELRGAGSMRGNEKRPAEARNAGESAVVRECAVADAQIANRSPAVASLPAAEQDYLFPSVDLLQPASVVESEGMSQEALEKSAGLLESVLEDFGIKGDIIDVRPGPVVTLYEFAPAPGVKSSRIINLSDDIARSMSALSARVAVVPGRNVIGIELPNPERETVYLRELFESSSYISTDYRLPLCLGKTIGGEPVIAELAKMPHLLVAGTTGSGKSVAINTMILSLIYHLRPDECRLIMVDPKMLELSVYDGIPHLLTPVVTDSKKAVLALKWAVREMEERYRKMSRLGVRNIDGFNMRVAEARSKGETILVSTPCGFDRSTGQELFEQQELDLTPLPYIVVIVDEMADLMMVAGKEIEGAIQRLAQMARAAGIHLIMATQRPSVDVITGTIKANFPTRVSFQVTSKIDSRTILGEQGAEHLLGQGDMLHMVGGGRIARVHGPFVSDHEVEKVVAHLKSQGQPSYLGGVTDDTEPAGDEEEHEAVFDQTGMGGEAGSDDLYERAVKVVQRDNKCSTSYIQRRLSIGYNRAASLVERMEQEGLVGPPNHVGKREILNLRAQPEPDDG